MLFQISSLFGKPVFCLEANSVIGRVFEPIIDPKNGELIAFKVLTSAFSPYKIVSSKDIVAMKADLIVVQKESSIVAADEILKVKDLIKKNIPVLKNWVKTKNGEWLGKVDDVMIESETAMVVKYFIKGLALSFKSQPFFGTMQQNRIIPAKNIISITKEAIIVKDEPEVKVKEKVEATAPEPA